MRLIYQDALRTRPDLTADVDQYAKIYTNGSHIAEIIRSKRRFIVPNVGEVILDEHGDTCGAFALKRYNATTETFLPWLEYSPGHSVFLSHDKRPYEASTAPVPRPSNRNLSWSITIYHNSS